MSTKYGIPLSQVTALTETPFREIIRVVNVNEEGKLCIPVREVWAKREKKESDVVEYMIFSANVVEDAGHGDANTLDEVNDLMRDICLQSLQPAATRSIWHVTRIVRAGPGIWRELVDDRGHPYLIVDENGLLAWLKERDDGARVEEVLDTESNWGDADKVDKILGDRSSQSEGDELDADDYTTASEGDDEDGVP